MMIKFFFCCCVVFFDYYIFLAVSCTLSFLQQYGISSVFMQTYFIYFDVLKTFSTYCGFLESYCTLFYCGSKALSKACQVSLSAHLYFRLYYFSCFRGCVWDKVCASIKSSFLGFHNEIPSYHFSGGNFAISISMTLRAVYNAFYCASTK